MSAGALLKHRAEGVNQSKKARAELAMWASCFDAGAALERLLGAKGIAGEPAGLGCGYGTFTLPAALLMRESRLVPTFRGDGCAAR